MQIALEAGASLNKPTKQPNNQTDNQPSNLKFLRTIDRVWLELYLNIDVLL
jgi:hypothetical protein